MSGFTGVSDITTQYDNGKIVLSPFQKVGTTPEAIGVWHSVWNVGNVPAAGGNPAGTPGAAYTSAGINFTDTSPATKYLLTLTMAGLNQNIQINGIAMIYDRLVGVGGISLTTTGDKTISSAALTRYTSGYGVQAWLEVSTATTTTAPVVTLNSYTDEDGNTGQTGSALTFPAAATDLHAMVQLPLGTDQGIRAASTLNVGTAAAAGAVNFLLLKPLAYIPISGTIVSQRQFILQAMPPVRVYNGASIGIMYLEQSLAGMNLQGRVEVVYN